MKRYVEIDMPINPKQLAEAFCEMDGEDQADFFDNIWKIAKTWPGAGWCQQSYSIAEASGNDAIQAIRTLASHLPADDIDWIVQASKD